MAYNDNMINPNKLLDHAVAGYDYYHRRYAPDRSLFTDAFNTIASGGLDSIEMVAKALTAAGIPADGVVSSIRKYKASVSWDDPSRKYYEDGARRTIMDILRSTAQSLGTRSLGIIAGGAIGLATGGPAGMIAGAAVGATITGGPIYGLSTYYDFMEDARNHGIPDSTVRNDAILAAVSEGGLEMASDLIFGRLMGLFGSGKEATKSFMKSLAEKTTVGQFTKKFMVSYLKTAAEEIPTELAQDYFSYHIRKNAGLPVPPDLEESLKNTAIVTAGTSALFALGGLGGSELRKRYLKAKLDAATLLTEIQSNNPDFDINDINKIELTEEQVNKAREINDTMMLGYDEYMKYMEDIEKGRRTLADMVAIASRFGPVILWNTDKTLRNQEGRAVLGSAFKGRGTVGIPHPLIIGHELGHHLIYHNFINYKGLGIPKSEIIAISKLHRRNVYKAKYPNLSDKDLDKAVEEEAYNGQNDWKYVKEGLSDFVGLYLYNPDIVRKLAPRASSLIGEQIDRITRDPQDTAEVTALLTAYSSLQHKTYSKFMQADKQGKITTDNMAVPDVGPEALMNDTATEFEDVMNILKNEYNVADDATAGFMTNIILRRGGLPEEPTARNRYIELVKWSTDTAFKTKVKGITNLFNPWVSTRYGFADLEAKTGVAGLHKTAKNFMYKTGKVAYDSSVRINKMFEDNGIDPSKLADDPETVKQVVAWLYESNDAEREKIASNMSEYALRVAKVVNDELQGETATNIRIARWMMWRTIPRATLDEYLQLYHRVTKNKASREDFKRYGKLQGYFESILPPDLKPEYGVAKRGKDAPLIKRGLTLQEAKDFVSKDKKAFKIMQLTSGIEELVEADNIYEAYGLEGLKEHLSKKTWGTRKHYYMSSLELDDALEQFVNNVANPGVLGKHTTPSARPGTKMREAHTRVNKGIPKEAETFLPDLYNHIQRAAIIADSGLDMIKLSDMFLAAMPKTRDANSQIRTFKRFVMNAMGFDESAPIAVKTVERVNRFFWRTYPFAISRPLWYTFRNLTQNIMAVGQLNTPEVLKSIFQLSASGTSDMLKRHFSANFKSVISQKLPIFRHFMMMEHDVVDKKYKRKMIRLLDTLGQVIPFSDEVNRILLFPVVHNIAERNVSAYKDGKIDFDTLARKTSLNNLHPQEILDIQDLLRDGKYDEAIYEISAAKVANTHFRYRTAERAGIEQHRTARPLTGLYNWPRGLVEATYYNGVKPFVVGMQTKNYGMAFSGLMSITKLLSSMFVARELLKKILGKKDEYGAYDTFNTIFGYSPGSAGLNLAMDIFEDFKRAHDYARDGDIDKAFYTLIDRAAYHLPLVADAINVYEATHDRRGVKMMRLLDAKLRKAAKEPGKSVKRTTVEKWQHMLFGTEEISQSETKRKEEEKKVRELISFYTKMGIEPPMHLKMKLSVQDRFDVDRLIEKIKSGNS